MRLSVMGLAILVSCKGSGPPPTLGLLHEVREALTQRDTRLSAYFVHIETTEAGQTAAHDFTFRAPNKLRGDVSSPRRLSLAFDGTTLSSRSDGGLELVSLDLPPAQAAALLATTFHPFVPEGFRTPLIPRTDVTATRRKHPLEANAIEVSVIASQTVRVTYLLRLPNGDFLEKRLVAPSGETVSTVTDEQCLPALGLCVPARISIREADQEVAVTTISAIDAGHSKPLDFFRLEPNGNEPVTKRTLTAKP